MFVEGVLQGIYESGVVVGVMSKNKKNVDVPLDWILEVLQNEKVQLPSGRIENMGE